MSNKSPALPKRVLMVDDDCLQGRLLASALVLCGIGDVVQVTDGHSALRTLNDSEQPFDLIITDLNMAEMDGIELLHKAAQHKVKAVALTSAADQDLLDAAEAVARATGQTVIGTLQKPIDIRKIEMMLSELMRGRPNSAVQQMPEQQRAWRRCELKCALDQEQFVPYFQPKVNLSSMAPTGAEILARWIHPRLGVIGPDQFIELMEDGDLIETLTDSMLHQALECAFEWDKIGPPLGLALNVAPITSRNKAWPNRLFSMVRKAGIEPGRITIEVTETGIDIDPHAILESVTRLRMFGFKVSVDYFGVGHSTLLQLSKIPFTELKIDRFFVSGKPNGQKLRSILESVMILAKKLGLRTVAEGIEHEEERDYLLSLGYDVGQGYMFSKPMSHTALIDWLKKKVDTNDSRAPAFAII